MSFSLIAYLLMRNGVLQMTGAVHVRKLPAKEFCNRGFVFGRAIEDGLGNEMYKILTAAGLGVMLNRSLIIAERGYVVDLSNFKNG